MKEFYKVFNKLSRVYTHVARIALSDKKYAIGVWNNEYILDIIFYNIEDSSFDYYGSKETYSVMLDLIPEIKIKSKDFGRYVFLQNKELKAFINNNMSHLSVEELEIYENLRKIGRGFIKIISEQEKSFGVKCKDGLSFVAKGDCQTFEKRKKHDWKFHERMQMYNRLADKGYGDVELLEDFFKLKDLYEKIFKDGDKL